MSKKKIYEADEAIVEMVKNRFAECGFENFMNLQVMAIEKQKDVIKVAKAPEPTEFLMDIPDTIQVFVYENVFNELDEETQKFLVEFALQPVWFDDGKGKVVIERNPYKPLFDLRHKYGERADEMLEASYLAIKQFEERENE